MLRGWGKSISLSIVRSFSLVIKLVISLVRIINIVVSLIGYFFSRENRIIVVCLICGKWICLVIINFVSKLVLINDGCYWKICDLR